MSYVSVTVEMFAKEVVIALPPEIRDLADVSQRSKQRDRQENTAQKTQRTVLLQIGNITPISKLLRTKLLTAEIKAERGASGLMLPAGFTKHISVCITSVYYWGDSRLLMRQFRHVSAQRMNYSRR